MTFTNQKGTLLTRSTTASCFHSFSAELPHSAGNCKTYPHLWGYLQRSTGRSTAVTRAILLASLLEFLYTSTPMNGTLHKANALVEGCWNRPACRDSSNHKLAFNLVYWPVSCISSFLLFLYFSPTFLYFFSYFSPTASRMLFSITCRSISLFCH